MDEALRDALQELVALKKLKDEIDSKKHHDDIEERAWAAAAADDYERRKPLAWEAARAALSAPLSARRTGGQDLKTAGIAIDSWKLSIFERHLKEGGYEFINAGKLLKGTLLLKVSVAEGGQQALAQVVLAANTEAARTNRP